MKKLLSVFLVMVVMVSSAASGAYTKDVLFADVDRTHWGYDFITDCVESGVMRGTGENIFSPDSLISVAEVITIATRLFGIETSTAGDLWYDDVVDKAIQNKIIQDGQFASYEKPATRAEVAGILALAKPDAFYEEINSVEVICDVSEETSYSEAIYKLYRAGVLEGKDGSGLFAPNENITRAEVANIVARIIDKTKRRNFVVVEGVTDYTVRTTDKKLIIGGVESPGIVEMGGKYFFIPDLTNLIYSEDNGRLLNFSKEGGAYFLDIKDGYPDDVAYTREYSNIMIAEKVMGTAQLVKEKFYLNYNTACYNTLYTLEGHIKLIRLDAIGAYEVGNDFVLPIKRTPTIIHKEEDLVGASFINLQREDNYGTALAIHDYIVNTLTYDPLETPYAKITQADLDDVNMAKASAEELYHFDNNRTLASKYGVCHHYALLIKEMYLRSGIPCRSVVGRTDVEDPQNNHEWNRAFVDGKWLYIDATWDDPISGEPVLTHTYFLVDADKMALSRLWDDFPMPDKYDPEWEKLDTENITSADMYRKCLVAQIAMGKESFSLHPVNPDAYGGNMSPYFYWETSFCKLSVTYNAETCSYEYVVN